MNKLVYVILFFVVLLGVGAFIVFYPIANFPKPQGPYGVGLISYHWIDTSRKELNAQDPEHPYRELMVYVYYPTERKAEHSVPLDADATKSAIEYLAACSKLPAWLFSSLKLINTYVQPNAPLAVSSGQSHISFPVIIFSPGHSGPLVQTYTVMLEELASKGFVVVGIHHPYVTQIVRYPDGRVIYRERRNKKNPAAWKHDQVQTDAQDISFVITKIKELFTNNDELWHYVDVDKIGVLGHSFGGRTVVRATNNDARIRCGINLDGGIDEEDATKLFTTPFIFVKAEKSFLWNKDHPSYPKNEKPAADVYAQLAAVPGSQLKVLTINDVGHSIFSDASFQLHMTLLGCYLSHYVDFGLALPAGKACEILTQTIEPGIIKFFDEHLKVGKERDAVNNI